MSRLGKCLVVLSFSTAAPTWAVDRNVPADFPTIQSALDAALHGDRVVVAPGRYYEALRFPARNIHMFSTAGPVLTTIDAQQNGTVVTFAGAPGRGAILEGFTLTNGLDPGRDNAGGVHMGQGASATVRGNIIRQNLGYGTGHGVSLTYPSSPLIEGNEIRHNRSGPGLGGGGGGGIGVQGSSCAATPNCGTEIRNNYIGNNYVTGYTSGGGIDLNGARATVTGNVIEYNTATSGGGGLSSVNGSPARIENNLFHANRVFQPGDSGGHGGGIDFRVCSDCPGLVIVNNTFVANEASIGSAINATGADAQARITNNLISAIGNSTALHCATGFGSPVPITRYNIVHAPQGSAYGGLCAALSGVNGNQTAAPLFAGEFDFRLQPGSPGVDEGDNAESGEISDLAGRARLADGDGNGTAVIDVGAYELPPPTIFANGFESTR